MNIKNVFECGHSCSAYDSKAVLNQKDAYLNTIFLTLSSPLKTDGFIYSDFHLEELQPSGTQLLQ